MKEKPFELKPLFGIKAVLTVLCVLTGAIVAQYLFR